MVSTIILFIVILGLLVFVHELGHFALARRMRMGVDEFGFGFPPRAFGAWKNKQTGKWDFIYGTRGLSEEQRGAHGTIYSVNWLPLGGFVKIKGEQGDQAKDPDSFAYQRPWRRALVLGAGVMMNMLFAFLLISIGFGLGLPTVINDSVSSQATVIDKRVQIVDVEPGTPAESAGLQPGDVITSVDGESVISVEQFQTYTRPRLDTTMSVTYTRGNDVGVATITPQALYEEDEGAIGIALALTGFVRYPWYQAIWMGAQTTISVTWQILSSFGQLIGSAFGGEKTNIDVAGPVGVAALTGQIAKLGFIYILQFAALLSINLAIINAVPFPALDGGRLLFLLIEKIRNKALNQRVEAAIHNIGFIILIVLVLAVTVKDISRFTGIFEGIKNIF